MKTAKSEIHVVNPISKEFQMASMHKWYVPQLFETW